MTNTEAIGRFHSDWLTSLYPRLRLSRNLLKDDGGIFISIDDRELHNLRKICDEIFGEENFIATFIWEKRTNRENRKVVSSRHDNLLCYCRDKAFIRRFIRQLQMTEKALANYKNPDSDPRGPWKSDPATAQAGHGTKDQFYIDPGRLALGQTARLELDEGFRNSDILLTPEGLLKNVQAVQRRQNISISSKLEETPASRLNLDIEMETGTGKTYCYTRTAFELNRRYGWSKFIVVVPSIAIAATSVDLKKEVDRQQFREDLYYRLAVFPLHLPPLRERMEDLELLVQHFARQFLPGGTVSTEAMPILAQHEWPGNIRELRLAMERAASVIGAGHQIRPEHFLNRLSPRGRLVTRRSLMDARR